jgi:putative ABC transport system permease protein
MLGIIIGNASVIAMVGVGEGAQQLAAEEFASLGPNVLFVRPGSQQVRRTSFNLPKTLILEDAIAIAEQVPTVSHVAPQIDSRQLISYRNQNTNTQISGTTPDYPLVRNFEISTGRFINDIDLKRNNRIVVLGSEIATRFFGYQNPIGQQIRIKNISFKVVGVLAAKGAFLGVNQDENVYIPLTTMANQIVGRTSVYGTEISFISVSANH